MERPATQDLSPSRPRIFGIGLNKTGTMSFDRAMTILGYESLHDGGPEVSHSVKEAIDDAKPLLSYLDPRLDAFSDIGLLSRRFGILDNQYPGSRFVLTTRHVDDWIDSPRRHVQLNLAARAAGKQHGTFLVIDEKKWAREWQHHTTRVRAYFQGRDNFLEIDLIKDPSWQPICNFLDVPEPAEPFPWINRNDAFQAS